ncbi:unnamed protein product [Caenorhabditis nigoni]|uniref:DUF281 domain-containing protein n=1 Tax=Caenorhabditis nigoni TaxID=1611254 RepID=A0A2G5UMA5_9PELO|nr:hypothetical protein B9Z55_011932 [Caenorhabditis nigoni]
MKFLFCLLSVLAIASATTFTFDGLMKCESKGIWCFTIRAMEYDLISNDEIAKYKKCNGPNMLLDKMPTEYKMSGSQDNDGLLDNYFEVGFEVTHNCTGTEQYIYTDYVEVPVKEGVFSMSKNFDLNANDVMP